MKLKHRTILITGGTSGIGKALAGELQKDNTVIITGRSKEPLEQARRQGLATITCDITKRADIEALVMKLEQEYPELDTLINNAGVQYNYNLLTASGAHQKIQHELDTNLSGAMQLTHLLLPLLSTKPSAIVNVTSALGAVPKTDGLVYSASKAGLRSFTRGLRKLLRGKDISVVEVIPPVTDTRMTAGREEGKMPAGELVQIILRQWAGGRRLIAPGKIKLLLLIDRFLPGLADKIIR